MIHVEQPPSHDPPFVGEVSHVPEPGQRFTPSCRIVVSPSIRSLCQSLPARQVQELLTLMSFFTPNGRVAASTPDMAGVLGGPAWLMRARLLRLAGAYWHGQPLVWRLVQASGRELFQPSSAVYAIRELLLPSATLQGVAPVGRERVITASRATYARPRHIVEKEIIARQGWQSPEEQTAIRERGDQLPKHLNDQWAVNRLTKEGVDFSLSVKLVKECGAEACVRQVQWLPYRHVKNKKRYLAAAILGSYKAPTDAPPFNPKLLD